MAAVGGLILHGAATSSCSFRVRIALNFLGLNYQSLVVIGKDRSSEEHRRLNPQGLVPVLQHGSNKICQSIAIIEYLNDVFGAHSKVALLPDDPADKARVRSLALFICCDVQPLQNARLDTSLLEEVRSWGHDWLAMCTQKL
jgi:maleylacetoacetate isomerase